VAHMRNKGKSINVQRNNV